MTSRLFVSLEIKDEILNRLIILRNEIYGKDYGSVKWEKKEKLHLTLKFLGDVENEKIPGIKSKLEESLSSFEGFYNSFTKFGLFYRNQKPAILWAGLEANNELKNLYYSIDNSLNSIGFEKEKRSFKPHITILRIKGFEDFGKIESFNKMNIDELKFEAEKVVLYKSNLLKSGSVYEALDSFKLK